MRHALAFTSLLLTSALSTPALAGDKPLIGPAPDWVAPAPEVALKDLPKSGNVVPLFDEQVRIDGDTVNVYVETMRQISTPEILNKAGTITFPWQPDHGNLTIHRIEILRGDARIDVLGKGDDITVLRREAGLERLMVNGQLTAVRHVPDLRVGDTLRIAFSVTSRDTLLKGHVQDALVLFPAPIRMGFGRARLIWPRSRTLNVKSLLPGMAVAPVTIGDQNEVSVTLPVARLPDLPKNFPERLRPQPLLVFSDFADWAEVAAVMAPLYRTEGTIAEGSDLARAVDAIAARSTDPLHRMADALRMVQDDVRYQLVALGAGNYQPQTPAQTWQLRYGDCKAKTMLLLAVLARLGIEAEPVLANSKIGDAVAQMPAAAQAFDHVFVHARNGGEDFWLDGTMLGSRLADIRDVPRYGQVLPVRAGGSTLIDLPRRANARNGVDVDLAIDASSGPYLPSPFRLTVRYAGTWGESVKLEPGGDYDERLQKFAADLANSWVDSTTVVSPHADYDADSAVWTVTTEGVAYPEWSFVDGRYQLALPPRIKVTLDADRSRSIWKSYPALIERPWTAHSRLTLSLPDHGRDAGFEATDRSAVEMPAVSWARTITTPPGQLVEDITSRESGAEIAPADISAASRTISEAMARRARVLLPARYPLSWNDIARQRSNPAVARMRAVFDRRIADKPDEAGRYADRGWFARRLLDWDGAEADYAKAIALDPTAARYADRGRLRAERGDHPGAAKDAQAAYDLESGNDNARDLLASELAEAGKVDDALALYPPEPDTGTDDGLGVFLERIEVLETGNRHEEALDLIDAALEKHPGSARLRNSRCWYQGLRNAGLDSALADCNRAVELSDSPAAVLDSRAMVHFRAGRFKEARADLEAALALSPEQAPSRFMHGLVLDRLGEKAAAAEEIRAAERTWPAVDHYFARFGIARP